MYLCIFLFMYVCVSKNIASFGYTYANNIRIVVNLDIFEILNRPKIQHFLVAFLPNLMKLK